MWRRIFGSRNRIARLLVSSLTTTAVLTGAQQSAGFAAGDSRTASSPPTTRALVSDKDLASLVEDRVERWQPVQRERRMDEIGWAKDIRSALRLARENHRPIFLFTHDGRINIGRC